MKKLLLFTVLTAAVLVMGSCGSTKNVPYFKNIDSISLADSRGLFDARIMPKDELIITVITTDPEASKPFNLTVSRSLGSGGSLSTGGGSLQAYLVDNDGFINFPILGKLHAGIDEERV